MKCHNANAEMAGHARAAAEMVRLEYGRELDFSEPTVGAVEAILNGFWKEGDLSPQEFTNISLLFGAYIGEMIRTCYPRATWLSGFQGPDAPSPAIQVDDITLYPVSWCYKRLYNGPQDSVVEKYLAFRAAHAERHPQ